jgi:cysteine/glycine-rich protein
MQCCGAILYCKHHFSQLFKEKGSYNHLMKFASVKRTEAQTALDAQAAQAAADAS